MISCILGSKDRDVKIKKCLETVYANYSSIGVEPDIIIIDGGSGESLKTFLKNQPGVTLICENGLHGVTRAYNRGFRLAKYDHVTWLSDDLELMPNMFANMQKHFATMNDNDIIAISMDSGSGFMTYKDATPVGFCKKSLMKKVDFWSEDYITYYSDIDFCFKPKSLGGTVVMDASLKMIHRMDLNDELHLKNVTGNICTNRGVLVWNVRNNIPGKNTSRIYPNILVTASSASEMLKKVQRVWKEYSWCNIYVNDTFNLDLSAMNVFKAEVSLDWHFKI